MTMRRHNVRKTRALAAGGLLLACAVAHGQAASLPDPTRPPPGFVDEVPKGGAGDGAAARAAAGVAVERPAAGLQSVLIPRQGKPVAVIGGKYVPLGERWEGWELVAVRETEVALARGRERKVLRLTPDAEKRTPGAAKGGATGTVRTKEALQVRRDAADRVPSPGKESETGR